MPAESTIFTKIPPHSVEAEESLLGAMLQNYEAISVAITKVSEKDFYVERNRILFNVLVSMHENGHPVNAKTVLTHLKEHNLFETVIGSDISYLMRLVDTTPTPRNAVYYAEIIADKALLRDLISSSQDIQNLCFNPGENNETRKIADMAEKLILSATERRLGNDFVNISDLINSTLDEIEQRTKLKDGITGVPTGYYELDDMTGGFQPSDLIIIAARPSMGKTSFAMNIAENVAASSENSNFGVGIFSLEMSRTQIAERLISSQARVELGNIRKGHLMEKDWASIGTVVNRLYNSSLLIDDSNPLSILELKGKARQMQAKFKEMAKTKGRNIELSLIIVDYLQLLSSPSVLQQGGGRTQEVADISRGLKALAKELSIPIIALSQLNRSLENRQSKDKRPKLSDLRESGSIEQDADLVLFLHRETYFNRNSEDEEETTPIDDTEAEVIIGKHRNGPMGMVKLKFTAHLTRFDNPPAPAGR